MPEISVEDLKGKLDRDEKFVLIDVRERTRMGHRPYPGRVQLIPLGELHSRMSELDNADEIVIHCKSGVRSANAVRQLRQSAIANVEGGILAWADRVVERRNIAGVRLAVGRLRRKSLRGRSSTPGG